MKFNFNKERWLNAGKYAACILLLAGMIVVHYFSVQWADSLHVKKIVVQGNAQLRTNEILSQLHISRDSLLMNYQIEAIEKNLLSNTWVGTVEVERILPSTLSLSVTERMPIAMVIGKETVYIDSEGVVLHQLPERPLLDVPVISSAFHIHELCCDNVIPYQLRMPLKVTLAAFRQYKSVYHLLSEIHTDENNEVVLYTLDSAVPILIGRGGIEEKLWKVSEFWKTSMTPASASLVQSIDARFKERIIVKWKNSDTKMEKVNG